MKKYTHKIRKASSHSYAIIIPKELMEEFGWREKQKLDIVRRGKRKEIIIKDWKPKK